MASRECLQKTHIGSESNGGEDAGESGAGKGLYPDPELAARRKKYTGDCSPNKKKGRKFQLWPVVAGRLPARFPARTAGIYEIILRDTPLIVHSEKEGMLAER
jgi:hypothetical protein